MKKEYVKPIFDVQRFCPNEFVAACQGPPYSFHCNADLNKPMGKELRGILIEDANNNNRIDGLMLGIDKVINLPNGSGGYNPYHPCGLSHEINQAEFDKLKRGFLISEADFNAAHKTGIFTGRPYIDYISLNNCEKVKIFAYQGSNGWHASTIEPLSANIS